MSQHSPSPARKFDEIHIRSSIGFSNWREANDNEIYAEVALSDVRSMVDRLVEDCCRLASVFAEDR